MSKTDAAMENLKSLGYTDEKLQQIIPLVLEDLDNRIASDFATVTTDQETMEYENKISVAGSPEEIKTLLLQMAQKAYGQNYQEKFDAMFAEELEKVADLTSKMRDTYHKYMSGDPATVSAVRQAENSPELKKNLDEMKAAGFDFVKAATE